MIKLSIQFSMNLFGRNRRTESQDKSPLATQNFVRRAEKVIEEQTAIREKSTVDNYRTALRSFTEFIGSDIPVGTVDSHLMEGFQRWLHGRQIQLNTISCYMRSLRTLLHIVCPEQKGSNVFGHVFTGRTTTEKRALTVDELRSIMRLRLPEGSPLCLARDLFLFSVYALGMPFVDIAFLRTTQLNGSYINYSRHKTGQPIRVKIEQPMQHIIDKYRHEGSIYVFPVLTSADKQTATMEYERARARHNRLLVRLGVMAGVQRRLTSYCARHSWATIAYHANIELSVISKALGHASPNTTLTYLREIEDHRIDEANSRLLHEIAR